MSFAPKMLIAGIVVVTSGFFTAQQSYADTYHHIDSLANTLEKQAVTMLREFDAHFRHTSEYPHLRADAHQLIRLTSHIHEIAHHHGSVLNLAQDVEAADRLFHHMQDLVARVDRCRTYGHIHGHVSHVYTILYRVESTIHHLQSDLNQLKRVGHHGVQSGHGHSSFFQPRQLNTGIHSYHVVPHTSSFSRGDIRTPSFSRGRTGLSFRFGF